MKPDHTPHKGRVVPIHTEASGTRATSLTMSGRTWRTTHTGKSPGGTGTSRGARRETPASDNKP
jgi:hypothetical protein